jgi:hypothetical protein
LRQDGFILGWWRDQSKVNRRFLLANASALLWELKCDRPNKNTHHILSSEYKNKIKKQK